MSRKNAKCLYRIKNKISVMSFNVFTCEKPKSEEIFDNFQTIFQPKYDAHDEVSKIYIGKYIYQKHVIIEEIDVVRRIAQTEWCQLQNMVLYNYTVSFDHMVSSRDVINSTFRALIESLQMSDCPLQKERFIANTIKALNVFSMSVIPIIKLEDNILLKISTSTMKNVNYPMYQYFHAFLEVQYYLLTLDYICGVGEEKLETKMSRIMQDLITISKKNYKRANNQNRQVFACNCMKNFWLVIQLFTEKIKDDGHWFWRIFNNLLENEEPMFTIWLLKDIAYLQSFNNILLDEGNVSNRINPNYILLEGKLRTILSNAGSDILMECLRNIEPMLCNIWLKKAKIGVFQLIWDYYSKRLNISNKKIVSSTLEFNELIDSIIWSPIQCNEDFEIFVGMLICHLREYPSDWGKMKGRIYSQLGPNKVKDLNEIGITHVMLFFMSLASINFNELSKKIISFVELLPLEKRNTTLVWKIYAVFLIKHVKEHRSLEKAAPLMLQLLQDASSDQKMFRLIKEFIMDFEHIINLSLNMQLYQWLLLNTWISKYMATCYYTDLKTTLDVLLFTLDKVSNADSWPLWEPAFKEHIYPTLKQISNTPTAPDVVGKMGGKLCILIPNITVESFNFFNSEHMFPQISCQFLNVVLENYSSNFIFSLQQESMVLQSWVKICLLTTDFYEDLTKNVLKLDCLPPSLKSHIIASKDPIYAFIEYLGSDLRQHVQSSSIIKLCEISFGQMDRWLTRYLVEPESEAVVFRVYTCISLAFLHCGPLLYDCNKSTSPLTRLVQVLLLPTEFLIGKAPHAYVLNAVKKTWHLFFEAIVKLNNITDTFLERTLRDMILKYMKYFSISDSPIIKCFENNITAPIILDKISNLYLKHPVKESDASILKVLKIISDFVQSTTSLSLMRLIVNKTLCGLFEVIIFHTQRNVAISVVKMITCSPLYPQIKGDFINSVIAISEKHLAFNTNNYFQLMYILVKFIPADINNLLGIIKQQVSTVERMRGVGFDKNLRTLFEKLETGVQNVPK